MCHVSKLIFLLTLALLPVASLTLAGVPELMNYQGRLTDGSGTALDTTVSMEFAIYDDSTGGVLKWAEAHPSVMMEGGMFNIILGEMVPIDDSVFNQPDRWLGITVGSDPELMPRTHLVSVGYAYRVSTVDGSTGGIISGDVSIQSDIMVSGKATIGPGHTNSGTYAFVAGSNNVAGGDWSSIGGGEDNTAIGFWSAVGGGESNSAGGENAAVGGGYGNIANGWWSAIPGGYGNTTSGDYTSVVGGFNNTAGWLSSAVGGGASNNAVAQYATVCGGVGNDNRGDYSVIAGGMSDSITADATYSMTFGRSVYLNSAYRVVFFEGSYDGRLGLNRDDNDGGLSHPIHVGTDATNGNGAHLTSGGVWTNGSSREFKENFSAIDNSELLSKIDAISVESWNFKNSDERHIGPVAEDFVAAFDVGTIREADGFRENQYLAAGDVAGVALAGIKALLEKIEQLELRNRELEKRITELEGR